MIQASQCQISNKFLYMTPKAQITRGKIDKFMDFFLNCVSEDTIRRVKRQPREWEKIFANHISDKELIFKIYKKLIHLIRKTKQNPFN